MFKEYLISTTVKKYMYIRRLTDINVRQKHDIFGYSKMLKPCILQGKISKRCALTCYCKYLFAIPKHAL